VLDFSDAQIDGLCLGIFDDKPSYAFEILDKEQLALNIYMSAVCWYL